MLVFGDPAPPSPKWWAPWIYTAMFAGLAAFLSYGESAYGPLRGVRVFLWLLWLAAIAMFLKAMVVTLRRLATRRDD